MEDSRKFLDPRVLARIKDLELQARRIIEGLVSGSHKSPYQGVSVEFAEHREYVPGDDTRHIDWKLFGKTDKFYLKQYEQETNLVCNFALDSSESMNYASGGSSKFDHAARLIACLAYLVLGGRDASGLMIFEDRIRYFVPPSSQPTTLRQILHLLAVGRPSNEDSKIGDCLDEYARRLKRRSVIFLASDCFDDLEGILRGLKHLRHKRHDVVLFHVLDSAEIEFPFEEMTMFEGLERMPEFLVEPRGLGVAYRSEFAGFLRSVEVACRSIGVDYQLVRTDVPLEYRLAEFLIGRASRSA